VKIKRTKRGDKMAIVNVEDLTGSVQIVLFPDVFNRVSLLLKSDEPLLISGNVETGDTSAKLIAQEILALEIIKQKTVKAIELGFVHKSPSKEVLEDLLEIVFRYPGDCRILFKVNINDREGVLISAHDRFNVLPCAELLSEIEPLTDGSIHLHEKSDIADIKTRASKFTAV
jgi:DNA polymerase III subunit alpha